MFLWNLNIMRNNNLLVVSFRFHFFNDKIRKRKCPMGYHLRIRFFNIYMGGKAYQLVIQTTNCRDETKVTFVSNREEILAINWIELWPIKPFVVKVHRRYFSMSNLILSKNNGHTVRFWVRAKKEEIYSYKSKEMKWWNLKCDDNIFCFDVS